VVETDTLPRVLVASASKHGSTTQIADAVAERLRSAGLEVDARGVTDVPDLGPYGAVVVGSAVYAGRWRKEAVGFLKRHRRALAERTVWLFQSGPLSFIPEENLMGPPKRVRAIAEAIGVLGHVTFGGSLDPSRTDFPASAMVRRGLGKDFRDFGEVRAWADEIARALGATIGG
jgi:menaquinone-dependent protoporphyrinogen oxidase